MSNFKNELKEVVGKALFSFQGEPSGSSFIIQYGHERLIITVAKILDAVNEDKELSLDYFLSLCSSIQDSSNLLLIGEIRLLDPAHNVLDVLGSFRIGNDVDHNHMFGRVFYDNLQMIDGDMPKLLEVAINIVNTSGINKSSEILQCIIESNPLHITDGWKEKTYRFKFGKLLYNFALGMPEDTAWYGRVPNGGILCFNGTTFEGFGYYDQTTIGDYLITSSKLVVNESSCDFKLLGA